MSWEEEVDHAAKNHVVEGVDPCVSSIDSVEKLMIGDLHKGATRTNRSDTSSTPALC